MGYTIRIGQLDEPREPEYLEENTARITVLKQDDAPSLYTNCPWQNQRMPSYSAWEGFTQKAGLHDLFYNTKTGLMAQHPGCAELTQEHLAAIKAANRDLDEYESSRLAWLTFWVEYALKNCSKPGIENW